MKTMIKPFARTEADKDSDILFVRIDNGTGNAQLVDTGRVKEILAAEFQDTDKAMHGLARGYPIRCTFATYQHRDFYECEESRS